MYKNQETREGAPLSPKNQSFPPYRLWAIAGACAILLAACGGSDDSSTASAPPSSPSTNPTPNTPTPTPETPVAVHAATAELAVLSTTDLHTNIRSYDYYKLAQDPTFGFERTATLIRQARSEFDNSLLVDNGDTVQGTALADYQAQIKPVSCNEQLAMYKAMGVLKYDVATLGNHEFNYGLPFLNQILGGGLIVDGVNPNEKCAKPGFAVTLANVLSEKTKQPLVAPYVVLDRTITATQDDGTRVQLPIKVGFIGITTPGIMNWDKRYLEGKVSVVGGIEAAQQYIPQMRKEGADLVFLLLHGGMSDGNYSPTMENPGAHITAKVAGIDGMVMGHQHNVFPDRGAKPAYTFTGVDNAAGTVNGVPAVMPSSWGKALGVLSYSLKWDGKAWSVDTPQTTVNVRSIQSKDASGKNVFVDADATVAAAVETEHQAAIDYVKSPIGSTDFRMTTLFADVGDPSAIQLVNQAQQDFVRTFIAETQPENAGIPVLSISAPFKAGFQGGGDYTDVAAGGLAINNAADLYLYPNTIYAVKVTGAELKLWLENAAQRFNQINPSLSTDQWLIKDSKTGQVPAGESAFAGYNFDMFTDPDVAYEIDVTQPKGSRIKNLTYKGQAVDGKVFIVATNNYRAESSASFILGKGKSFNIVLASPEANRDVLIKYIKEHKTITRDTNGAARSWRFTPVNTAGKVLFKSGPNATDIQAAQAAGLGNISLYAAKDDSGNYGVYRIELAPQAQ